MYLNILFYFTFQLDEPLVFSETIKPIRMADYDMELEADTPCTTSGYGLMDGVLFNIS